MLGLGGLLKGHHIIGERTYDEDKVTLYDNFEERLGIYHYGKHAETVYDDLMKATASSEPYRLPNPNELVAQSEKDGTIEEVKQYEEQWLKTEKEGDRLVKGCLWTIGILFVLFMFIFALL